MTGQTMLGKSRLPFSLLWLLDVALLSLCNPLNIPFVQEQQTRLDITDRVSHLHNALPSLPSPLRGGRPLHGRFLHITDLHPDPYYKFNATVASACHRLPEEDDEDGTVQLIPTSNKNSEQRRAGYWGTPESFCDNSIAFVNLTLDWLEQEWADHIDFVVWTGDNARHDEDPLQPRTLQEIFASNTYVAERMHSIFTVRGIPVVASLGNNDIWPHNILEPGPNVITRRFASIWEAFIPFSSYQVFMRGGYYSTELIENQLAALSLNTLYFYEKNKAIEGCTYGDDNDPGNLQLAWMEVQLGQFRDRGVKVWLTGHVPPTPHNYHNECYRRYVELSMRYRDTIVGHLYGHMNIDFFFFLDADDLKKEPKKEDLISKKDHIHKSLKKHIKKIIKKKDDFDGLAVVNVAPAGVGNPYRPGLRVFAYNREGEGLRNDEGSEGGEGVGRGNGNGSDMNTRRKPWEKPKRCQKKKNREEWECRGPEREWYAGEGPAEKKGQWTALGYSQFWVPELEGRGQGSAPTWELEYVTYGRDEILNGHPLPVKIAEAVLPTITNEQIPYEMDDLTLRSWLRVAEKVWDKKKQWKEFKERMYLSVG